MSFAVSPLSSLLGAEIVGLDLDEPPSEADLARIERAFVQHGVLVLRDQVITPEAHLAFSRRFGELQIHVQKRFHHPEHPAILVVSNVVENGQPIGLGDAGRYWHSDLSYMPEPSMGSLLHAQEIPPEGGDTLFASQAAAYDLLDDETKSLIDGLSAVHDYDARNRQQHAAGASIRPALSEEQKREVPPVVHPVVRIHPASGRRTLFVNEGFTTRVLGSPEPASAALLQRLFAHQTGERFIYRHVWRPHDLVMWDNRATLHLATGFPQQFRRKMFRTTVKGDRPVGPAEAARHGRPN